MTGTDQIVKPQIPSSFPLKDRVTLPEAASAPDFALKEWCDVLLTILQVSHCYQNLSIRPKKLI
ncbi:MAG: hypothetical protein OET21_17930, partial [Desulfobacterales bacterium]|nr:hypothetical protein [Desulfobacterales bacterium]